MLDENDQQIVEEVVVSLDLQREHFNRFAMLPSTTALTYAAKGNLSYLKAIHAYARVMMEEDIDSYNLPNLVKRVTEVCEGFGKAPSEFKGMEEDYYVKLTNELWQKNGYGVFLGNFVAKEKRDEIAGFVTDKNA